MRSLLVPTRAALWLLAVLLAVGIAAAFVAEWLWIWQVAGTLLGALLAADAFAAWRSSAPPRIERIAARSLAVGEWHDVTVRIGGAMTRTRGWLQDAHPASFEAQPMPQPFSLAPGQWTSLSYRVRPLVRGNHRFGAVTFRLTSPLGFWQQNCTRDIPTTTRVYPDFAKITQYILLAVDNRLSQIGVLQRRRRGEGLDFQELREYRQGDTSHQIDWKATARHGKLISREYQDERDQYIVFMLDCGQRMRAHDRSTGQGADALSHFSHTLNALLLLSYVALRQGDAVGVLTFAHPEPRYLPPRKSIATVNRILNGIYDLEPTLQTSDYVTAGEQLARRLNRRALIVLLTNVRDEDDALLSPALRLLQRRHLILLANLREMTLDTVARTPIETFDDALTYGAAAEYLRARSRALSRLRRTGVQLVDAYPSHLPRLLVNKYLEMKRGGWL
jgi:uncharacterized protein (DUF58 family)